MASNNPPSLPWYRRWFDHNYLLLYCHRDHQDAEAQVRLILDTLDLPRSAAILDLGCGEGRHAVLFQDRGYRVFGLDLSADLVKEGRQKYGDLNFIIGDMRAIPGRFDLIVSLFTSFGYFEGDGENRKVLDSVFSSLHPGGIFWLDFLNPHQVRENLVPETVSCPSAGVRVRERRRIADGRIVKDIYFEQKGVETQYVESVALYTRKELESMLLKSGFRVLGRFGNYQGEAWSPDSERTILFARREG
jgi:SAM-dependent methyltransferase